MVTGGSGFIGSYVVEELLSQDIEVLVLDRSARQDRALPEGVIRFLGDVTDSSSVTEAAAHVDGIVHLAAVLGTQETVQNPRPAAEINVLGGLNVLEAAAQYELPMVYAGVGNHWMRNHAGGTYTITKTVVEDFCRMFNAYRGGRISVVRPVNAYGPRQSVAAPYGTSKVRKIVPSFAARALMGHDVEVYGDGTQISACVYVEDVANVMVEALLYTEARGAAAAPFEVGPAESPDVATIARQIIDIAAELTGRRSNLVHLPMRPGEVPNAEVMADGSTLAPLALSPEHFVPLEQGLRRTLDWFQESWFPGYEARAS